MALITADRVREFTSTNGTGAFTLTGAAVGYQTFASAIGSGNTCYYAVYNPGVNEWEVGIGTVGTGVLARTTVLKSSNSDTLVDFSSGTKDVFVTYPAEYAVFQGGNFSGGTLSGTTITGTQVNITGQGDLRLEDTTGGEYVALQAPGTLASSYTLTMPVDDGTPGQALVTDGSGNLAWSTAASGDVYGPASSTDNAVTRFDLTTGKIIQNSGVIIDDSNNVTGVVNLTSSGSVTLSGGTANGVAYLNGSKVLTTGSALTFDGTNLGVGGNITASAAGAPSFTVGTGSGSPAITLYSAATNASQISFAKATSGSGAYDGYILYDQSSQYMAFGRAAAEGMRLTSTGLGIGTSSPGYKLDVTGDARVNAGNALRFWRPDSATQGFTLNAGTSNNFISATAGGIILSGPSVASFDFDGVITFRSQNAATTKLTLDISGNLGLGVTPSAWWGGVKAFDVNTVSSLSGGSNFMNLMTNGYLNSSLSYIYKTSSYATLYQQASNGQHQWYTAPSGTAGNAISFTQAMTLDASGNLGIGTTAPQAALDLGVGTNGRGLTWGGSTGANRYATIFAPYSTSGIVLGAGFYGSSSADSYLTSYTGTTYANGIRLNVFDGSGIQFFTDGSASKTAGAAFTPTERMRITSSGNVGIGTSSPLGKLEVYKDNATGEGATLVLTNTGYGVGTSVGLYLVPNNGGGHDLQRAAIIRSVQPTAGNYTDLRFYTADSDPPAERMRITSGGEVYIAGTTDQGAYNLQCNGTGVWGAGAYVNGSDVALKENVTTLDNSLGLINAMRPVTFTYKEDYSKDRAVQTGFIAQELQEVLAGKDYLDGIVQAGPEHLNVAYQNLIPLLVKAVQELTARVAQLEGN